MEKTREKFKDKRILVWGYGREGHSTERLLREQCRPACVDIYEGPRGGVREERYDYVFVSPGIAFEEDAPLYDNPKFTSQTEVFLEEYGAQTIGITGTKGKSTTCSLLYTVLSACDARPVFLMGNIGKPCFDYLPMMTEEATAVFELSCHQCQRLQAAPHIAVFLNLYGDHLDRYHTMEHYYDAKCGITRHQTQEDFLYMGAQVPPAASRAAITRIGPAVSSDELPFCLRIPGAHNQLNARFVHEIAVRHCGCEPEAVRAAMETFPGLPHRLEHCATIGGVDYYDDSISTIPQATIRAVSSVPHVKTVLIGGMDRGVDYTVLEDFIREHGEITFLLAYASGKRILKEMGGARNVVFTEDLADQVKRAMEITPPGGAVVMSNAAASYGYFKDFEERGEVFKRLLAEQAAGQGPV